MSDLFISVISYDGVQPISILNYCNLNSWMTQKSMYFCTNIGEVYDKNFLGGYYGNDRGNYGGNYSNSNARDDWWEN